MKVLPLAPALGLARWEILSDNRQRIAMVYTDGSGLTCSNCTVNDCEHISSVVRAHR